MNDQELLSLNEAARRGITRLRQPNWPYAFEHIEIDITNGKPGPYVKVWSPFNHELKGSDPQRVMLGLQGAGELEKRELIAYDGPLPDSKAYRAEVARVVAAANDP